jgi:AcrR family transcriptional regulator
MKANKTGNDKLFKAGRKLFWKYGFRRVSVDEICREAGVSKMTFYRAFEDKQDLAKTIFRKVAEEGVKQFIEILPRLPEPKPARCHARRHRHFRV